MAMSSRKAIICLSTVVLLQAGVFADAAAQRSSQRDPQLLERALVAGIAMGIPGISAAIGVGDSLVWAASPRHS